MLPKKKKNDCSNDWPAGGDEISDFSVLFKPLNSGTLPGEPRKSGAVSNDGRRVKFRPRSCSGREVGTHSICFLTVA